MAASITPGSTRTSLNGTTPVTIVAAPAASTYRIVLAVRMTNIDTAAVTVTLKKSIAATSKQVDKVTGAAVNFVWTPVTRDKLMVLAATNELLEMVMSGAAATTNPEVVVEFVDKVL
jgi:hypothetical protein